MLILLLSSFCCYIVSIILAKILSKVSFKKLGEGFLLGLKSSLLPIMILILAWSLKSVCDDLETGKYIVSLLGDKVNPLWMPIAIFIISALTAFSTGTSWGTMAILIPTVSPLAMALATNAQYGPYVALCLAAILDGAIMGDHCSPVSDTTIMSSISTDCDLIDHVKTQLPYSLIVGVIALTVGYLPSSYGWPYWFSVLAAVILIVSLFVVIKKWPQKRRAI